MTFSSKAFLHHPHDNLARLFLGKKWLFIDFLVNYLNPAMVDLLDLDRLVYESPAEVDGNLKGRLSDIRYATVFKNTRTPLDVFIFLEHQSTSQPYLPFRFLDYIVDAYRRLIPELEKSDRKTRRLLPYPLAIILHHGKMPWKGPLTMGELVGSVPGLNRQVLDFPLQLIDLAAIPTDNLKGDPFLLALLDSLQAASEKRLSERFEPIMARLKPAGRVEHVRDLLQGLVTYAAGLSFPKNGMEIAIKTSRRLFGIKEDDTMAKTWMDALQEEGIEIGRAEGRAEGKAEGKAEAIVNILTARFGEFPASLKKRLNACADVATLDRLAVAAATCRTLNDFKHELVGGKKEKNLAGSV